jgi:hypothetical protein
MTSPAHRPRLSEPSQAEKLFEAAVEDRHLAAWTALLVCCDASERAVGHVHLLDCDPVAPASELTEILDTLMERLPLSATPRICGLCLGLTRPGNETVQQYDRAWFRALHRLCARRALKPYGVYVVTRTGVRTVSMDDAA